MEYIDFKIRTGEDKIKIGAWEYHQCRDCAYCGEKMPDGRMQCQKDGTICRFDDTCKSLILKKGKKDKK